VYRLSESSVAPVADWIASNRDRSIRERLLTWLADFAEHPDRTPWLPVRTVARLQAYLVPGTDVVVAAIVDRTRRLIDLVTVETLQDGSRA
jgi:hypothetical protein